VPGTSHIIHRTIAGALALGFGGIASAHAQTAPVPDLSGFWNHSVAAIDYENPPGGGPGPVKNTLPITGNNPIWVGNFENPILKPHAAQAVKTFGELEKVGRGPPTAQMLCKMSGVPTSHTLMGPMQIMQTPDVVLIVHQRDHQVRRVYMNRKHSEKPVPTWYGESVGHYEGDTLVVSTIGLNDKTVTDRNGTPHSDAMRVVERYRLIDGGRTMQVLFHVEDPNTFTTPWNGMVRYQRNARQQLLEEEICAENNFDVVTKEPFPIPTAETPDF
jgi:hypothetical protein